MKKNGLTMEMSVPGISVCFRQDKNTSQSTEPKAAQRSKKVE